MNIDLTSLFIQYIIELHLSSETIKNTINKGIPSKIIMGNLAYELYSDEFSNFAEIRKDVNIDTDHIELYWDN